MPASRNRLVDLPQPDGPSSATNSPSSMARSIPGITSTSPKRFAILRNSTPAIDSAFHAADRHLHQVALGKRVEDETRDEVEDTDGGDHAVVDSHHIVADVVHVEA